jgi:chorismate mutase / prephenate dehydratase
MNGAPDLEHLRGQLDNLDRDLVQLIARRLDIVASVGAAKAHTGSPVRDVERERAVLEGVEAIARQLGVPPDLVRRVFREIIGHAVDRQAAELIPTLGRVNVGFHGAEHGYTHLAALKHLAGRGDEATYQGYETYADVVAALESGNCDLAVLPIEDTTAGSINQVYDLIQHSDVAVVGEETWRVDPTYATTEASGPAVARRGTDHDETYVRFVVLAAKPIAVDVRVPCKTSLVLSTRHEEGALLRCLEILAGSGHSMTKLESRPRPGRPFEYLFFLDFEGNVADPRTQLVVDELRSAALYVKVLGSYPAKVTRSEPQPGQVRQVPATEALEAVVVRPPATAEKASKRLVDRASRAEDTLVRIGDVLVGGDGFVVMAGPCSVESAEQVNATARAVRDAGAHVLRGGVFKPRTSPYAFQGLGWEGLTLLAEAGRSVGLPIITEVMAVEQVAGIARVADVLQVGARNMQNFDLLRALGKVDRPVLLKRGLSSTIDEWLAAAEYILSAGNQQVILCERGIRTFESATRNTLDLSAVPVVRERTHLPVIVDPSHGTGKRRYVAPMSRAALAVGAHGLLIEVHPDPDTALSDADQSLDFTQFTALMAGLGG